MNIKVTSVTVIPYSIGHMDRVVLHFGEAVGQADGLVFLPAGTAGKWLTDNGLSNIPVKVQA